MNLVLALLPGVDVSGYKQLTREQILAALPPVPRQETVSAALPALDDPRKAVRMGVGRFLVFILSEIKDPQVRKNRVAALARQLSRPSNDDRQKAVYALHILAKKFPEDRPLIWETAGESIQQIARQCITTVQPTAQELLKLLTIGAS